MIQALIVGASSFLYLLPAYSFYCAPATNFWNRFGVWLFIVVSICSASADGSITAIKRDAAPKLQRIAEMIDRWTATSGGAYAVAMFFLKPHPDPVWLAFEIGVMITCVLPLHFARVTPVSHAWQWVALHCLWHFTSAFTVAWVAPHYTGNRLIG